MKAPKEMTQTVPGILARIVDHKRAELTAAASQRDALEARAATTIESRRDFRAALTSRRPSIIAEVKKASPSKGLLCPDFDPRRIASLYRDGGAAALSVLTDEKFFQGSLADLAAAREASGLPVLRKDFTIDEFHVVQAAAAGADAILLIAAILTPGELCWFREMAASFGLAAIVEVHDSLELEAALDSGADIIGVNNRNLHDFSVHLETSLELAAKIPSGKVKISESGIHSPADVRLLLDAGYQAFLVGEHLMKSPDPAAALAALAASADPPCS